MGKKKAEPEEAKGEKNEAKDDKKEEEEKEDPQIIKDLKELDDKYLAIEKEYEKAVQELQKKFNEKQQPLLDERTKVLKNKDVAEKEEDKTMGTPAVPSFWLQAIKNHPALEDSVLEWDEPVLEYCSDMTKSYVDDTDYEKGFRITMHFVENPYFEKTELWKEYHTDPPNPYNGEASITEIKVSEIDWKPGKNITVEKVSKKAKGGGAKKAKQKGKEKEEPRDSFFRNFFRALKLGDPLPDDVNMEGLMMDDDDDDEDDDGKMEFLMEQDLEIGTCARDHLIPFAVRWYTGEAAPEDDDDDFDEDGEEDDDDDDDEEDDDDEDDEDEPPARGGKASKNKKLGGGKADGKGGKQEDCKQQ